MKQSAHTIATKAAEKAQAEAENTIALLIADGATIGQRETDLKPDGLIFMSVRIAVRKAIKLERKKIREAMDSAETHEEACERVTDIVGRV